MSKKFTCALCGRTYNKKWTDEEAAEELADKFPGFAIEECGVVCDDCYNLMGLGNG
jgi:hypothetical protein